MVRPGGVFTGFDWFQRDELSWDDGVQPTLPPVGPLVGPVCRHYALAGLISCSDCIDQLGAAGFTVEKGIVNGYDLGDLEPNWQRIEGIRAAIDASGIERSPEQEMMKAGGEAICAAVRSGALVVGYWRARL